MYSGHVGSDWEGLHQAHGGSIMSWELNDNDDRLKGQPLLIIMVTL